VGEVGAGAVPACGVVPPDGDVAGDVDAEFHHQLGFHQRDVLLFPPAPCGEFPVRFSLLVVGEAPSLQKGKTVALTSSTTR
jgi:hypothetical protein